MPPNHLARIFHKRSIVPAVCIAIVIVLLAGIFPPFTKAQAQREIAASLLRFVIRREIGATAAYIRSSGQPWVEAPPDANIIIWAPAWGYDSDQPGLSPETPIQVWWYTDGQLIETQDKQTSILEYRQRYMENPQSNIWAWGHYAFGILSISRARWLADVCVEVSCGPLCGHGFHYKLLRVPFGNWWIIKADHLWQA